MYKTLSIILLIASTTLCRSVPKSENPICHQEQEPGVCKAYMPRYSYDRFLGTCVQFIYGGCGGNENNFRSEEECLNECLDQNRDKFMPNPVIPDQNKIFDLKIANTDYPCSLPMDMGMCFAYLRRYYYKSDEARCVEFIFGGCRGNSNNFDSLGSCQQVCEKQ